MLSIQCSIHIWLSIYNSCFKLELKLLMNNGQRTFQCIKLFISFYCSIHVCSSFILPYFYIYCSCIQCKHGIKHIKHFNCIEIFILIMSDSIFVRHTQISLWSEIHLLLYNNNNNKKYSWN